MLRDSCPNVLERKLPIRKISLDFLTFSFENEFMTLSLGVSPMGPTAFY